MGTERFRARLRLEEPEVTHLQVEGTRETYCGGRKPWEQAVSSAEAAPVTCDACRSFARVRASMVVATV